MRNGSAKLAWGLIVLLGIVHFDFWWWDNTTLVFGFVPMALAVHAGISIAAALSWALVVRYDWPDQIEAWAAGGSTESEGGGDAGSR